MRVEFKGFERLREALRRAPETTVKEIGIAVRKSGVIVTNAAIKESPVNKQTGGGQLRQNIRMILKTNTRAEVISNALYSHFVEGGTSPHTIIPRNKKALANKRTGQFFGKIVHHPGTRANPFMRRALTQSQSAIDGFFREALQKVWESLK
jgi:HK97 gp10 family phage protein